MIGYSKSIDIIGSYDVVVCGGGPAGWAAAVSASRQGCKTALIERYGFLGGSAAAGLVTPLSGYYFNGERVVGGIAFELVERLGSAAQIELPKGHISFHPEHYKLTAQKTVLDSGTEIFTNTVLIDCIRENGNIKYAVVQNKSGLGAIEGKCFIDATGDADLAYLAGLPMLERRCELQPATLCFILENVDTSTELLRSSIRHNGRNGKPSANAVIHDRLGKYNITFGGPWFNTLQLGSCLAVNMTRIGVDATDARALTDAEHRLRCDMFALVDILKKEFDEFKSCEIVTSAVNAGIREARHIKGIYTMTADDVINAKIPMSPVARCTHPMDIHSSSSSSQSLVKIGGKVYVPYETMICKEAENFIAAGRCISAEREPYASLRVMGTVMCIGESAGIAASISVKSALPVWDIPRDILNKEIRARNVFAE